MRISDWSSDVCSSDLVPGRWQAAVESVYGFIDNTLSANVGPEGRRFVPLIFSLFMFIIVANFAGLLPVGVVPGVHRSEERRVGNEWVRTGRFRWPPYH